MACRGRAGPLLLVGDRAANLISSSREPALTARDFPQRLQSFFSPLRRRRSLAEMVAERK